MVSWTMRVGCVSFGLVALFRLLCGFVGSVCAALGFGLESLVQSPLFAATAASSFSGAVSVSVTVLAVFLEAGVSAATPA